MSQATVTGFPLVLFSSRDIVVDAALASQAMTKVMVPARITALDPAGLIDATVSYGIMPGLHLWQTEVRRGLELRALAVEDRQIIYFPGQGRFRVETPDGMIEGDDTHGVSIEAARFTAARFFPGRSGAGMAVDRPALLQRLAILLDAPVRRRLLFETRFDAGIGHRRAVAEMIRAVTSPALGGALTASPTTASKLSTIILDLVLTSLPHNFSEEMAKPPKRIAPRHVKRAIDHIESFPRRPITIDELAAVCNVSVRSLQYGFREFLDISPADYIRNVRLEGARQAIIGQDGLSLTEIAGEWGFTNLARFSEHFRAAYGETPSELRRRRATDA